MSRTTRFANAFARAALAAVALAGSAQAAPQTRRIDLPAQRLDRALATLVDGAGGEVLADARLTAGRDAPALHGVMSLDEALDHLLRPAGLSYYRTPDGVIVVTAAAPLRLAPGSRIAPADDVGAVSEILVTARRALNADIPRSPDDIQPYRVIGADTIRSAGDQTVEDFLKTRVSANALSTTFSQMPIDNRADPRSQVDLRGLGTSQTLVLVDGRRLPGVPATGDFLQANLNGIPMDAIARIETLSSTAGGIYGPGATGGVVNIVLKRQDQGVGVAVTSGVTDRGDGRQWRFDGHAGFTSPSGGTRISLAYSHALDHGIEYGSRDFVVDAHTLRLTMHPGLYFSPVSQSLNVQTLDRNNLVLKDAYGGGELSSFFTSIPASVMGTPGQVAQLVANVGNFDQSLADDTDGAHRSLTTDTSSDGLVFTLRQTVTPRLEAFLDILAVEDRGRARGPLGDSDFIILSGDDATNPFVNGVILSFPLPTMVGDYRTTDRTGRATVGLVAALPHGWKADVDFTVGRYEERSLAPVSNYPNLPSPFEDAAAFAADLAKLTVAATTQRWSNNFLDGNIRLGGALWRLPGGPLTLTVSGEWRRESSPGLRTDASIPDLPVDNSAELTQTTRSAYGELRAPLISKESAFWPLRGLELQLAGRIDRFDIAAPGNVYSAAVDDIVAAIVHARPQTTAETLGLRFNPLNGVMVRASYATGYLPPRPSQVATVQFWEGFPENPSDLVDPLRGDLIGSKTDVINSTAGSPKVKPEKAVTLSAGVVVTPPWIEGLRVSVDYTHIAKSREISNLYNGDVEWVLDNPSLYASRVTRAPLTAEDIAEGYTVGSITAIDTTYYNLAHTMVDAVDLDVSYDRITRFGAFHVYGQGSWEPNYKTWYAGEQRVQWAGYADGPLKLKGNAGVTWVAGPWTAGADVQAFGGYKVSLVVQNNPYTNEVRVLEQGANKIRPQAYLNLFAAYRAAPGPLRPALEYSLRIDNVLGVDPPFFAPPLVAWDGRDLGLGYSVYGDPRGRRAQVTIRAAF